VQPGVAEAEIKRGVVERQRLDVRLDELDLIKAASPGLARGRTGSIPGETSPAT
jgi:hypothetical protein